MTSPGRDTGMTKQIFTGRTLAKEAVIRNWLGYKNPKVYQGDALILKDQNFLIDETSETLE